MKELSPFSIVRPIQGEQRRAAELPDSPLEVFPILAMSPFGYEGVRDFRPKAVEDPHPAEASPVDEETDEGDADPKAATSSVISSVEPSDGERDSQVQTMHPSTQSPDPATPVSAERESSQSSESPETKNDGWPLPPALV